MKKNFYNYCIAFIAIWLFSNANVMAQEPSITLIQPTADNIELTLSATYRISWAPSNVERVNILLSDNGGNTYDSELANNVGGSTWDWNTNGFDLGSDYKIKIVSATNSSVNAESEFSFALVNTVGGYITMIQPTGGEEWLQGSDQLISWTDNLNEPVKVELCMGGYSRVLANSTTATTLSWTVPENFLPADEYQIKVTSTATSTNATSENFSIVTSTGTFVEVLQPSVRGIKWAKGTNHLISWKDNLSGNVNIYLVRYLGSTPLDPELIEAGVSGSTYSWDIPENQDLGTYKILISNADGSIEDASNKLFDIIASEGSFITVLQPNVRGIKWAKGTNHLISWTDNFPGTVMIELIKTGQDDILIADNVSGSTFSWDIDEDTPLGIGYKIKVTSEENTSVFDYSNKGFSIIASEGTLITVLQPNVRGIKWAAGTNHLISWTDNFPGTVMIELIKTGQDDILIADNVSGSTYSWDIDEDTPLGTGYKIKVTSEENTAVYDNSNKGFSIVASEGTFITVIQPNVLGVKWAIGTTQTISWIDNFDGACKVELYRSGGFVLEIEDETTESNVSWTIPTDLDLVANGYKIKVTSLENGISDFSDKAFSIIATEGTYVRVIQPNVEGVVWTIGNTYTISYTDNCNEPMKIELLKGNAVVEVISEGWAESTFTWTIGESVVPGSNYRIKVSSTLDPNLYDVSDAKFTIEGSRAAATSLYPNPANYSFTLNIGEASNGSYQVEMFNRYNRLVYAKEMNSNYSKELSVSTSDLPNGIYFVNITNGDSRVSKRVIIQH